MLADLLGRLLIDPFLPVAQERDALNENNITLGTWTHGDGWDTVYEGEKLP